MQFPIKESKVVISQTFEEKNYERKDGSRINEGQGTVRLDTNELVKASCVIADIPEINKYLDKSVLIDGTLVTYRTGFTLITINKIYESKQLPIAK